MQATKDTFYLTLRDRLATAYPGRTVTIDGITRAAMAVAENEKPSVTPRQHDAFYLEWGDVQPVRPAISTLMALSCTISYQSSGTEVNGGRDRGRNIAELESELIAICSPTAVQKYDYTGPQPADLGSTIFWTAPTFRKTKAGAGMIAGEASVTVYFYPEVNQA